MAKSPATGKKVPALITTDHTKRGVFFGYINEEDAGKEDIEATDIQMCGYWSEDVRGVLGLAVTGPSASCRVTKAVPKGLIKGVTLVCQVTADAEAAWKKQPWG